jgi:hypothetical protein
MSHSRRIMATGGFQDGQTAKARLGPPCAVTPPRGDMATSCAFSRAACLARLATRTTPKYSEAPSSVPNVHLVWLRALDRLFIFIYLALDTLVAFSRSFHKIPIRVFRYFRFGKQVAQEPLAQGNKGRFLSLRISAGSISKRDLGPKYRVLSIGSRIGPC